MSDSVIIALISGVVSPLLLFILNHFQNKKMSATNDKVDKYHDEVNSKLSQLIVAEKGVSHAEGKLEGKEEEKNKNK